MSTEAIKSSLGELFNAPLRDGEKRKIVYWQDIDGSSKEEYESVELANVKKHILDERNYFKTKYLLEVEDTSSNYLIYTQEALGDDNDNWLLDNLLYSTRFYADIISIYCRELNVPDELRKLVIDNRKFFAAMARRDKFKSYNIEKFTEEKIEIAIISALTNQRSLSFEDSLRSILMDGLDDDANKQLSKIESYFDLERFWQLVEKQYGYKRKDRSLKTLFIHLIITSMSTFIPEEKLDLFKDFLAETGKNNCAIFIDRWMNQKSDYKTYNKYAGEIEDEIVFSRVLQTLDIDEIKTIDIFPSIDRAIILYIVNALENRLEDFNEYEKLIRIRKSKHFYEEYRYIYEGLYNAIKMMEFKKNNPYIPMELPKDMAQSYVDNYYLMDYYYRKFYIAFDKQSSNEILQKLRTMVEGIYTNWFMVELSYNWSESISKYVKGVWDIPGWMKQKDFYSKHIDPIVYNKRKVFVIVSDALRYEVAAELCDVLDSESLGSVELKGMIAGLPTNTKLGMARLLPHSDIEFRDNGFVYIDKMNSGSMEGRKQILFNTTEESTAIDYKDFIAMSTSEISEFYKGKNLNYIYHNTIDAIGDVASTEIKAFDSTATAIEELSKLIKDIRNYGYGTSIYITSDHGFVYQRDKLEEVDKLSKENLKAIESKRRYILSEEDRDLEDLLKYSMEDTLSNKTKLNVYIPKANIRFRTQGAGANFVHGGASLQEVILPLIIYRDKRSGQSTAIAPEKTKIKLTNTVRRITNSIFTLNFFQTEKVGGKIVPNSVRVYMVDQDGEVISNEEVLLGDKVADNPEDRMISIRFILKPLNYDRGKEYYLIIKDLQTGVIYERIPFEISLGIGSDFDF